MTTELRRALGFGDVVRFFIVAVVSLRWIATAAAAGPGALPAWGFALVALFIPLAFAVVELSARDPGEGGLYRWTGRAFGPFAGFMAAWMYWVSTVIYLPGLLYFAAGNLLFVGGGAWAGLAEHPAWYIGVSSLAIVVGIALNAVGLDIGKRLNSLGAWSTWIAAGALVALGLAAWIGAGASAGPVAPAQATAIRIEDLYFWCTIAFAFGGLEGASFMGDEVRDARRTLPRAVLVAGLAITAIYVLGTAAVQLALPPGELSRLAGIAQAFEALADRARMPALAPALTLLVSLGALAGAAAWLTATSRILFVAGLDARLPPALGRLHPRWGTPVTALVVQGAGGILVALLGQAGTSVRGAYDVLVSMGVITYFVPFVFLFASLIRLQRDPMPEGALRVPGGAPVAIGLAVLGLVTTLLSIGLAVVPPGEAGGRLLAVGKVVGGSAVLALIGALLYGRGQGSALSPPAPPRSARGG